MRIVFVMRQPVDVEDVRAVMQTYDQDAQVYSPVGLPERLNIWLDHEPLPDPRQAIVAAQLVIGPRGDLATILV